MGDQDNIPKEHQTKDHYWEYFDSMTTQRTQVFYFYVVIASLFWTGLGATESRLFSDLANQKDKEYIAEMIILCFFVAVTFVFYMIEERCIQIVKFAECYIIKHGSESDKLLFKLEPTAPKKFLFLKYSFKEAYRLFFTINIIGSIVSFGYFGCKKYMDDRMFQVHYREQLEFIHFLNEWGFISIFVLFVFVVIMAFYSFYSHTECFILKSSPKEINPSEKCTCKTEKIKALNEEREQ